MLLSAVEASCVLEDIKKTGEILARAAQESKSIEEAGQEPRFIEARDLYERNLHLYRQGPCAGDRNGRLKHFSNMANALQKLRTISLQEGNLFARQANDILSEYNRNKLIYRSEWRDYNQASLDGERK